jgi:hypothetical protein
VRLGLQARCSYSGRLTVPSCPARYIIVDERAGRALFYVFVESAKDPANDPVVLWLNGLAFSWPCDPACSTVILVALIAAPPATRWAMLAALTPPTAPPLSAAPAAAASAAASCPSWGPSSPPRTGEHCSPTSERRTRSARAPAPPPTPIAAAAMRHSRRGPPPAALPTCPPPFAPQALLEPGGQHAVH